MGVVKVRGVGGGGWVGNLHLPVAGSKSHTTPLISTSTDISPFQVTLISVFSTAGNQTGVIVGTCAK